jgi:hypothetical protein
MDPMTKEKSYAFFEDMEKRNNINQDNIKTKLYEQLKNNYYKLTYNYKDKNSLTFEINNKIDDNQNILYDNYIEEIKNNKIKIFVKITPTKGEIRIGQTYLAIVQYIENRDLVADIEMLFSINKQEIDTPNKMYAVYGNFTKINRIEEGGSTKKIRKSHRPRKSKKLRKTKKSKTVRKSHICRARKM